MHEKSRADLCRSRFKADGFSRQYAHSRHTGLPGALLYDSSESGFERVSCLVPLVFVMQKGGLTPLAIEFLENLSAPSHSEHENEDTNKTHTERKKSRASGKIDI